MAKHKSEKDVAKAKIPTPETCGNCHDARVKQFKTGKRYGWNEMQRDLTEIRTMAGEMRERAKAEKK